MNAEPWNRPLDRFFLDLRQTLADTLIILDIIRELGPSPKGVRLLPNLYTQLGSLQRIVRLTRQLLKRSYEGGPR
jgi:hypothetical protein